MRIIAGLTKPTSGSIILNGVDITGTNVHGRSVSFVYQQFINYPSLPKSLSPQRIESNADVFGFALEPDHLALIGSMNRDYRTGVDPNDRN